ncbi:hypothetical protein ScPMuIL_014051 [Solemya velum]
MVHVSNESSHGVTIIADDTDVFVLVLYHFQKHGIKVPVTIKSPVQGRTVINITVEAHSDFVSDLPVVPAISGCNTVPCYQGIGKSKAIKTFNSKKYLLNSVRDITADMDDVVKESTKFIASCYSVEDTSTMSNTRMKAWSKKAGKSMVSAPKLDTLPQTTELFQENVKRAHFQACVWKHAVDPDPPVLDSLDYGWYRDETQKSLMQVLLPKPESYMDRQSLELLPTTTLVKDILTYLQNIMEQRATTRRRCQVLKSMLYAENLQVHEQRMFYEKEKVIITEERCCRVCKKRIGNSAFARYPNGVIVHYYCCRDPKECPVDK